jgi:glycosyltransferase involved in cell wall biosynthesis
MKKLCILANASSVHTHRWANYFAKTGNDVSVISFEECIIKSGPIKVYTIYTNKKLLFISFPIKWIQMYRLIKRIKPDVIHAHYVTKYGFFGALFGKHPFIISVLGSDILKSPAFFNYPIQWILAKADIIHCDAYFMVNLLKKFGVPEEKIKLVFFGTDTRKFSSDKKSEMIRARLGIQSEIIIIITRKLDKIYDIKTLIQAIPLVVKRHSNVKFLIVGDGDQKVSLVNLASSLKVSHYIIFLGFLPNNELPEYLASADINVSTSASDAGLAASTAEAMSSGIPVIITEFGDNSIWVKDKMNGLTFPIGDYQSLAEKIYMLIK